VASHGQQGRKVAPDEADCHHRVNGLDLISKTMISPGDKVIGGPFHGTIQCFVYSAHIIGAPIDADSVDIGQVGRKLIEGTSPNWFYLIPTFGLWQPRCRCVIHSANRCAHESVGRGRRPYRTVFDTPPPPSLLALSDEVPGGRSG
jgi:hypothetical protein